MKVLKKAALVRNKQTKTYDREINLHAKVPTILTFTSGYADTKLLIFGSITNRGSNHLHS